MFDIGWDEMAVIAVVSLIVIGPKDLPHVLRQVGRWTRKAREMASDFQRGVDDMVREAELQDIRQQVTKAADPNLLRQEVEKAIDPTGELAKQMEVPPLDLNTPAAKPADAATAEVPAVEAAPAQPAELPPPELPATAPFETPRKPPEP